MAQDEFCSEIPGGERPTPIHSILYANLGSPGAELNPTAGAVAVTSSGDPLPVASKDSTVTIKAGQQAVMGEPSCGPNQEHRSHTEVNSCPPLSWLPPAKSEYKLQKRYGLPLARTGVGLQGCVLTPEGSRAPALTQEPVAAGVRGRVPWPPPSHPWLLQPQTPAEAVIPIKNFRSQAGR